jgi:hypothetical protein
VVDKSRRLKILSAPHPPYFWIFGDFKGKLKDRHLQNPNRLFHGQVKIAGRSHYFSAIPYSMQHEQRIWLIIPSSESISESQA